MNIRNNYLSHYGIDGQRKGINRYQLTDGTWTEEGLRRRREREGSSPNVYTVYSEQDLKRMREREARTAKYADTMSKSVKNTAQAIDNTYASWNRISDNPNRYRADIDRMTDDELRRYINRLALENQYTNLRAGREDYKQRRGKEITSAVLSTAGGVAVTGASAIGIITAIKGMRLDKAVTKR